jgi:hypothetical protein
LNGKNVVDEPLRKRRDFAAKANSAEAGRNEIRGISQQQSENTSLTLSANMAYFQWWCCASCRRAAQKGTQEDAQRLRA